LLADKVGLVKTLSLVTCALISLGDDPTLILCLATLTLQWQAELLDKLGIPSAVWSSAKQRWIDHLWHDIRTRGPEDIAKQIAIVSTGLIFHDSEERRHLLGHRHGMVVLDEARQREALDNEEGLDLLADLLSGLIKEEAGFFSEELSRLEAHDLKLGAVKYFLTEHCSEGRTSMDALSLLRHGFSLELSAAIPGELIAVYAGADESSIVRDGGFSAVEREAIKAAVRRRDIRLLVATGAACNLRMLGTLINVDLPWNHSRLEQRFGRILARAGWKLTCSTWCVTTPRTRRSTRRMKDRFRHPARCDRGRVDRRSLSRCSMSMCICGRRRAAFSKNDL